jgi:hypothetical protein
MKTAAQGVMRTIQPHLRLSAFGAQRTLFGIGVEWLGR